MAAFDELEARRQDLGWQISAADAELSKVYAVLIGRNRPYSSLPEEYRTWSPDSLHKREAELKAKAQKLTAEYIVVERAIDALPARKRHLQQAPPFSVGTGAVVQQELAPERRRGWLRRLFNRQ